MERRSLADLAGLHMQPSRKRELTHEERRTFFSVPKSQPERPLVSFQEYDSVRTLVAYRVLRHIGRCLSVIARDEPLVTLFNRVNGSPLRSHGMPDELLQSASYLQERVTGRDTWLRPPRGDEKTLQHYRDVYTAAALALRITRTPQLNAVLDDFTDPRRYQDAMPSQECLEAFEYGLLEAIYDAIVEHGQTQARRDLEEHFQMGPHEAQEMVSTARFAMTAAIELDQETERKIQSERLERLASKAARESDDRLVLATIKERSRLLGLTDRPPENSMQQIADVIAKVSADEDPFVPMLPDASDDF